MEWLEYLYNLFSNFFSGVNSVLSYIWSMFQGLWYGLTTLLTGMYDIIIEVFNSGIF